VVGLAVERIGHTPKGKALLESVGATPVDMYVLEDSDASASLFHDAIMAANGSNAHGAAVHAYEQPEYRGLKLMLSKDGLMGVAVKPDGDIVSAFKHAESPVRKAAFSFKSAAMIHGGRKSDAFDTVLPDLYAPWGFKPVARIGWNDEYSPEGWNKELYKDYNKGEPDVVFFAYDEGQRGKAYVPGEGKRVDDYDKGSAEQQKVLKKKE
jgi:hypothetical protein